MKDVSHVPLMRLVAMTLIAVALSVPLHDAHAQTAPLCFNEPGITNCISGRFLQFWQQNGGLPVFGYPVTAQADEQTPEGSFQVQYFERERFELHPENQAPYDVLLGRLGDQLLERQGIDWQTLPKADPSQPNYFPETGHAVSFAPFYQYWAANGLQDPALSVYQRSLALFGYPLTEAATATNSSGDTVLTQWFERARFEYHPDNPDPYKVLLGLLGNEWLAAPPPPVQQSITITAPAPNAAVASTFTVSGTTALVPSNGTLSYSVFDANNLAIGQGNIAVLASGSGGTFSASISFTAPAVGSAVTLQLLQPGEAGQPPIAQATLPLVYQPAVQQAITIEAPSVDEVVSASPLNARGWTTLYPANGQLHYVIYHPDGRKVGEENFAVERSGDGSTFNADLVFTAPTEATALELQVSERDSAGNTVAMSSVRIQYQPPAPTRQYIVVDTPAAGTTIARTFPSSGRTTLFPSRGQLQYFVFDSTNQLLGSGQIPVVADGNGARWDGLLTFNGGRNGTALRLEILDLAGPGQPPVARASVQLGCCL